MDVVFAVHTLSFSSSKGVDVQSHDVHPSTANYAWTHVSIHAQLPSMVFSFPTNHVIPWLFKSFPCQSEAETIPRHRKATSKVITERLYVPCCTTHRFRKERLFQVLLSTHDKPIPLTLLTTGNTLRETKQICYSHSDCWSLVSALSTCIHKSQVPCEEASAETF